jgi:hypothetical protein
MPLCEGYRKPANCRAPFSVSRDQLPTSAVSGRCLRNSFNNSSQDSATFSTMSQNSSTMSRDEIVESVSRFYTFLTTHPYLPFSAIKTPPPAGWPEEYREIFCKMGKAEEVVDLLSHLPYIDDDNWEWFHDTKPINYISPLHSRRINNNYESKRYFFEPLEQDVSAHAFSLTNGKLYGVWLLLDIQAGMLGF